MKIFSFIRKYLYSFSQLHSNCVCMPIIVPVKITTQICKFYNFPMNFNNFYQRCYAKFFKILENIFTSFLTILLFICIPNIVSVKITTKIFTFQHFLINFHNLIRNVIQKSSVLSVMSPLSFFTYNFVVFVCLSLNLRFYQTNLHFYPFSYDIMKFIIYVRYKSLELTEYAFPSFFNCILIVFVYLSLYPSLV